MQSVLLQHYHNNDLPRIVWSDNGSQFRSVVADAVEATLGTQPRYIPPGRPQSNGLTEAILGCKLYTLYIPRLICIVLFYTFVFFIYIHRSLQ